MKWLFSILTLIVVLGTDQALAAERDTIFLDASWKITKERSKAKYYREIMDLSPDSMITVHDYYLSTGKMQMVGTYKNEMKPTNQHGRFYYYYSDGTPKAIYDYQWGIIHGELRRFYQNGNLKSVEKFDLGTKVDTSWLYYETGGLRQVLEVNKDFSSKNPSDKYMKFRLINSFAENGEAYVVEGNGIDKEYFLSGRLKTEIAYHNGFPHGKWIKYTGQKKKVSCIMTFKNGTFIKGEMYDNGKKDIFSSLQRKAYFPTGIRGLENFLDDNIGRCSEGFENEVIVLVNVSTEGKVHFEQIISGNVNACQYEEVRNMIHNMPIWIPAVSDGKYVEGSRSIKINFN